MIADNPTIVFINQFNVAMKFSVSRPLKIVFRKIVNRAEAWTQAPKNSNIFWLKTILWCRVIFCSMIKSFKDKKIFGMKRFWNRNSEFFSTSINWTWFFITVAHLIVKTFFDLKMARPIFVPDPQNWKFPLLKHSKIIGLVSSQLLSAFLQTRLRSRTPPPHDLEQSPQVLQSVQPFVVQS